MKKGLCLLLVLVLLCGLILTACGSPDAASSGSGDTPSKAADEPDGQGGAETPEPVTYDWFIPDPNTKIPPEDAPIMQQIFDATGVRFNRIAPPAEAAERLNLMLASGDIPDLITFWEPSIMKQYISAGKIMKLNDLMEAHAPNTFNENWEKDVKGKIIDENGDFWFIPGGYTFGATAPEADIAFNVRTDYWEENGYDVPETIDGYAQLLRQIQEWNPDIIPLGLALGPQGHLGQLVEIAASVYGLNYDASSVIYNEQTDTLEHYSQVAEIKEFFKYLNALNVEGLVDPESPIMSAEMLKQKVVGEQVWSFIGPWWEINSEVIAYEQSVDSLEQEVYIFPAANETVETGTYAPYTVNMFSSGLCVTTSNKDPERFIEFYEYANTEEGWMTLNGIFNTDFTGENSVEATEGFDWIARQDVLKDGKPAIEASAWMGEMWGADENWWWNRGVEMMGSFTYAGEVEVHPDSKYHLPESDVSVWWDENSTRINGLIGWTGTEYMSKMAEMGADRSNFAGLTIEPDQEAYTKQLAITKAHEDSLPRVIMAASEAAFEAEWTKYTESLESLGLSEVMAEYNALYQARMEQWNSAD